MQWNKIFFFSIVIIFVQCTSKNKDGNLLDASELVSNSKSLNPDGTVDISKLPYIKFDKNMHDFGSVKEGEKVQYDFRYTNTGKSALFIQEVNTSCGCTATEFTKDLIQPGESNYIKITYDSDGRPGSFQKTISVITNTQPNETKLLIIGDVIESAE